MNIQLTYRRTGRLAMRIVKNGDVYKDNVGATRYIL